MTIIQNGQASEEEANRIDELEALLHKQRSFKAVSNSEHENQGEVIASLFFADRFEEGIDKMYEYKITPEDFFGFAQYHYDDDHEDEELVAMFTNVFIASVNEAYQVKCQSK